MLCSVDRWNEAIKEECGDHALEEEHTAQDGRLSGDRTKHSVQRACLEGDMVPAAALVEWLLNDMTKKIWLDTSSNKSSRWHASDHYFISVLI